MKYLILILVTGLAIFIKPWELNTADNDLALEPDSLSDTSLLPSPSDILLPTNQVINNKDSELEITRKFDLFIQKFMDKWELKGASFALMKDDRLI